MSDVLIAVDAGKTNLRVAVFTRELEFLSRWSTPAFDAADAVVRLQERLQLLARQHTLGAVGLSTFGPLVTLPGAHYGAIHQSSAAEWSGVNLPASIALAVGGPVFFDYDVNAGALAESRLGAGAGLERFVYLSIGTGIGAVLFGRTLHPGYAPQVGHIALPREPDDLAFVGSCRFHRDCLQGLASGSAIAARWGVPAEELDATHPAWDLEARYLARACANLVYTFAPQRILLASSVALAPGLVTACNGYLRSYLNGFLDPATEACYAAQPPVERAQRTPNSSLLGAALLAAGHLGLRFPR